MSSADAIKLELKWVSFETHDIMPLEGNLKVDG